MNIHNIETPITLQHFESLNIEEKQAFSKILEIHKLEILRGVCREMMGSYSPIAKQVESEQNKIESTLKLVDSLYNEFISPQTSMAFERKDKENAKENASE